VAQPARDPQALAVTPDRFEAHITLLRQQTTVLPLSEMVQRTVSGKALPPRAVAITFDDGYTDNVRVAEPILARAGMPATLFVATGYVKSGRPFWWDAIETAVLGSPLPAHLELPFPDGLRRWSITDEAIEADVWNVLSPARGARRAAYLEIVPAVKPLDTCARERILEALQQSCGSDLSGDPDARPMKPQDVADIQRRGVIEIGAHTVNHPQLSCLDVAAQEEEIAESWRMVSQWIERPPILFAYPYGSRADYNDDSVEAVKRAGFFAACSNFPGPVDGSAGGFELPRVLVRNISAQELGHLVESAFAGGAN
jgi:peptidoglycan/xylan/chitin deacetylase (PgdA/CDA1 family)